MKRLLLALLLVLLAVVTVPQLREEAAPHFRSGASWAGERLEGPLSPALKPIREIQTETEMSRVLNLLMQRRNRGEPPITTEELRDFMIRMDVDSTATDQWGGSYSIIQTQDSLFLRSPGADITAGTDDDMVIGIRYPAPDRRRRRAPR